MVKSRTVIMNLSWASRKEVYSPEQDPRKAPYDVGGVGDVADDPLDAKELQGERDDFQKEHGDDE